MITLGIESTAHTFGISIIKDSKVLVNLKKQYTTNKGGLIPGKVADQHVKYSDILLKEALKKTNLNINNIDLIAFSQSPGIGHCLRIGATMAIFLSLKHNINIIGVNHCIAHLEIGRILTKAKDPVLLYASGANTQIIAYEAKKYRIFGETLDIGVGNFLDSFGRLLGLGFPPGPQIELIAKKGKKYIPLPYSVKGMDLNFGGILTKVRTIINKENNKPKEKQWTNITKEDLCYSVQETIFTMLIETAERAMAHTGKIELLLGGGVACNKRLQQMAKIMCKERNAKCYILENQYNVDNAAMIALTGEMMYKSNPKKLTKIKECIIEPYKRTDQEEIFWRK